MTSQDYVYICFWVFMFAVLAIPLGHFLGNVLSGKTYKLLAPLLFCENLTYKICGINPDYEMNWKTYAKSLLIFNLLGFTLLFLIQILQNFLPLNPQNFPAVPTFLALNTAISFVTNTNWQAYSGEATMSYFTQMVGLGVQNFLSAATGIGVAVCFARAVSRKSTNSIGNFWVDLTRAMTYVLVPLSVVFAFVLVQQGVIQNFLSYVTAYTLEGAQQIIPMGPAASQIAIKQLGSNGGGFFGVNSAHPFENPTALSNFLEMLAIVLIPASLPIACGRISGSIKHGYAVFVAMLTLFLCGLALSVWSETLVVPSLANLPFLEGKEMRFGIANSVLWSQATSATSNGSVNAMLSSYSPLAGGAALLNIMMGEVVFGGVGSGMYGIYLFIVLAVFIAGLMVGRSPEYLGKKIEAKDIKLAVIGVLVPSSVILIFSSIACSIPLGISSLAHKGPHGLSEILYAYSSAAGNNGSAFAGLNANTNFYNITLGIAMVVGRFAVILPALAIAGNLAGKKFTPVSSGTFHVDGFIFVTLLISTVVIVGALTFFPALCLGPIIEHILMLSGKSF